MTYDNGGIQVKTTRLSGANKRRLQAMLRQRDEAILCLQALTDHRLEVLAARAAMPSAPDGFPASSMPDGGSRGGADVTLTSVEAAAQARMGRGMPDPVRDAFATIVGELAQVYELSRHCVARAQDVEGDAAALVGRQPVSVPCPACEDAPVSIRGLCPRCYATWKDHGRPDFAAFVAWRLGVRDECPPGTVKARRGPWARIAERIIPDGTLIVPINNTDDVA